ncbi:cytochrome C [Myxococcus sp. Y35]|uniref:cytochrome C n=1 Tax=Pseudomyxococcus flavus TaxID=3115648 RepID=UPI003CE79AF9
MKHARVGRWVTAGWALLGASGGMGIGCSSDDPAAEKPPKGELAQVPVGAVEQERIDIGLRISPVPLKLEGLDRNLVGLGSYIVNAQGGCNDCHTQPGYAPGGDPFQGQPEKINTEHFLAGGRPFGPGIVSSNITPDAQGLPGGMTYEHFLAVMRTGREEDGSIIPVMPWPIYAKMRDQDLRAVYEYLRAIPPAQPGMAPPPAP